MPSGEGWHRGDRLLHRPSGQRGVVEGWKGGRILVLWGASDRGPVRGWVEDGDCTWEPLPAGLVASEIALMEREVVPPE